MTARTEGRRPALGFLLAIVALVLAPASAPEAHPPDGSRLDRLALLERAALLAKTVGEEVLTDDNCPDSPAGVVLRVGTDPDALAAFVRDRIAYEPYLGVVRGPAGTLAAGAGGDWDRAVWRQALLAEAGHPSRLVVEPRRGAERADLVRGFLSSQGRERTLDAAGLAATLPPPRRRPRRAGIATARPRARHRTRRWRR